MVSRSAGSAPPNVRDLRFDRFPAMVDSLSVGVLYCSPEGDVRYSNPAAERLVGSGRGRTIGRPLWELPDDEEHRRQLRQAFSHVVGEPHDPAPSVISGRRDREDRLALRIDWSCDRDHRGQLLGVAAVVTDVSDQKRATAALHESRTNLSDAQRLARMGSWELDLSRRDDLCSNPLHWSDEVFRIFGFEPGGCEVSNDAFFNAVHPDDREPVRRAVQQCLAGRGDYRIEHRIRLPDGSERIVYEEGRVIRDPTTGDPIKMLGIVQDISDRKAQEAALERSRERLRRVLDSVPAYVGLLSPDGRLLAVNQAPLQAAGLAAEDVLNRPLAESYWIAHSERDQQVVRESIAAAARGEMVRRDVSMQLRPGNLIVVDAVLVPIRGPDGEVIEIVGSAVDVTQRRKMEDDLQRMNLELEQRVARRTAALEDKNRELEAFAHSVSHDLRAPLRAMEGFASALREDFGESLGDEGMEYVGHIVDASRRMDMLISDLLAYSRLGRKELRLVPVGLRSAVAEAIAALQAQISETGAQIEVPNHLPTVTAHPFTLVQLLTNLLSNAIKFVAPGVVPRIRVRIEPVAGERIRIWIEDNGLGISRENYDRIFHVFERLHGVETYPGTGIGLAIVKRACERLGGAYGVSSIVGKGSRFWLELPLDRSGGP